MKMVSVTFERCTEILVPRKIPRMAVGHWQCKFEKQLYTSSPRTYPVGTFCIEVDRNKAHTSVIMPNGYPCPTGKSTKSSDWFPILKHHVRQWMVLSPESRLLRIYASTREAANKERQEDLISSEVHETIVNELDYWIAQIEGDLSGRDPNREEIVRSFMLWVSDTSEVTKVPASTIIEYVTTTARKQEGFSDDNLGIKVSFEDTQRFLDM